MHLVFFASIRSSTGFGWTFDASKIYWVNEYFEIFDTIRFYTHFEIFLRIFHVLIQILNLDWYLTGRNRSRTGFVWLVTAVPGKNPEPER
jgi:hypothetical protein